MIYRGYKILYDYHTHTVFSHGKGSIEDNVLSARKLGLKAVAISDHSVREAELHQKIFSIYILVHHRIFQPFQLY